MNEALKDFGGVFIETQGELNINECLFMNNTASNISLEMQEATDSLLVKGSGNIKIENSHFVKGSFIDEKTNFQVSLLNKNKEIESNNIFLIERCMFSIINPSTSQLYIDNENQYDAIRIDYSSFSHFYTRLDTEQKSGSYNPVDTQKEGTIIEDNYNHLYVSKNCIGAFNVTESCFDTREYLFYYKKNNKKDKDSPMEIHDNFTTSTDGISLDKYCE